MFTNTQGVVMDPMIIMEEHKKIRYADSLPMTENEKIADNFLQELKARENEYFVDENFRLTKNNIKKSPLVSILKAMPKGALLHTHFWPHSKRTMFEMFDTFDNLCINIGEAHGDVIKYQFMYTHEPESFNKDGVLFKNIKQLTLNSRYKDEFYESIYSSLQFYTPNIKVSSSNMWHHFDDIAFRVISLVQYVPAYEYYVFNTLEKYLDDGIYHVEMRWIGGLYDENGPYDYRYVVDFTNEIVEKFNKKHNANLSIVFIYTTLKKNAREDVFKEMVNVVNWRENGYRDSIVGFDMVDSEELYYGYDYYKPIIQQINTYTSQNGYEPLPLLLHAGETSLNDSIGSENLFHAIACGCERISHGIIINNYPILKTIAKENNICFDICPISNQLLRFTPSMKTHPSKILFSENIPLTISNDDSCIYGYNSIAYDFYYIIKAWNLTLRDVKKLCFNSIKYSKSTPQNKNMMFKRFNSEWNIWVERVCEAYKK